MPEMRFRIRWPDGSTESCYSPSLAVKDFLSVGSSYPLADFVMRSRTVLDIGSERVKEKFGWHCSRAAAQAARIETVAKSFAELPDARVVVDAFED
jgi:uncharacterized repeat protein (TIGR04042 family)